MEGAILWLDVLDGQHYSAAHIKYLAVSFRSRLGFTFGGHLVPNRNILPSLLLWQVRLTLMM